ncbi:MAG: 1-(5-phosphoribosyl)-5-[(5-phosphoribosylamino)methylideneamino]imidazole-4-carboxamide isomerase [Chloroflexi bacterium]|nr:1-(5-phosphoribosyl)-5-[(5-phosphoribosylamino)methylideneamino]imidazole-4-carboxamide isomerase [Chloroflexota bacterium]
MEIIPAIDLKAGRCVRLFQGDFDRSQIFSEDPLKVALTWQEQGARRLHIVDLDGAVAGRPVNLDVVRRIVAGVEIPVQLGGGIRDLDTCQQVMNIGVHRFIVGTIAVEDPALVSRMLEQFGPEALVVSVDAWDGEVAIRGWKEQSHLSASTLLAQMAALGVRQFIYTDISRDGTLSEPNFEVVRALVSVTPCPITVSGGISQVGHLVRLARLGVASSIVGKALYTGDVKLPEAMAAVDALSNRGVK